MITFLVAWINAKYKHGYDGLFFGTVVIDIFLLAAVVGIVRSYNA